MISNVVLVLGVQQSDSVLHIHVSVLLQIVFPFWLLQNIEQSFLCYTVGPCWLSILNIAAFMFLRVALVSVTTPRCIIFDLLSWLKPR